MSLDVESHPCLKWLMVVSVDSQVLLLLDCAFVASFRIELNGWGKWGGLRPVIANVIKQTFTATVYVVLRASGIRRDLDSAFSMCSCTPVSISRCVKHALVKSWQSIVISRRASDFCFRFR